LPRRNYLPIVEDLKTEIDLELKRFKDVLATKTIGARTSIEEIISDENAMEALKLATPTTVLKGIYSPRHHTSRVMRNGIQPRPGSKVLIIGGGTAADANLAASLGAAEVVVTGHNDLEIENIQLNVQNSPFASKIKVLKGDLFDIAELKGQKFDHIYMNPWLDSAVYRLLEQAKDYLNENGTLEITFIDHPEFLHLIYKNGWEPALIRDVLSARKIEVPAADSNKDLSTC
jgi:16S rRNA G1207 methylase RsmC